MKVNNKNLLLLLSLTTLLGACEVKKNVDEMHGATVEMNDTTKTMNENTEELKTAAGELYDALRQGDSLSARRAALDNLVKTEDPARKLSEAAKYFMSFEYQFWSNEGQDKGAHRRDEMATEAAREFFKDVQQFIPGMNLVPKPLAGQIVPTKKSNLINCLNALSVTTHFLNPKQELRMKADPKMTKLSMNKIIEDSLLAKESIESGEKKLSDYPGYVEEVLSNEAIAVYLLEARYNYMAALLLGKTTNIAHSKLAATVSIMKEWTLDLSTFNIAQTEEIKKFLSGSLKTKTTLKKLGIKPRTDILLARLINKMKVDSSKKATLAAKIALDEEIIKDITELKKLD
ncbi:hypothetical protein [Bdellovibrio sp. HCB337]|uniref:hypothetical protein n=1 Tax=Bdellovibrio sp. HCB337 TaxID=3394358 RepID=UPI0039A48C26